MSFFATIVLAFSMSMDAFAAAMAEGAALSRPGFREAIRTGLIFGFIETLTPLAGWVIGMIANPYIIAWNYWVAFALLTVIGTRMIFEGMRRNIDPEARAAPCRQGLLMLITTAFATSLDALAVGMCLTLLNANIVITVIAIGAATTLMVTVGVMLGRLLNSVFGKVAEVLGGVILINIGFLILSENINVLAY